MIDPVLANAARVQECACGSWWPAAAADIVGSDAGWHDPTPKETAPC